jgi:serine/threonine protein kinase
MSTPGDPCPALSTSDADALEGILGRFEDAWLGGERPRLEEYAPAGGGLRQAALAELAHIDLEFRLKAGEPARVEEYLRRFGELNAQPDDVLALIAAEYRLRRRAQPDLVAEEYLERFPQHRTALATLLDADTDRPLGLRDGPEAGPPAIPGYEILGKLGEGGMGTVYEARHLELDRLVALKVVHRGLVAEHAQLARFRREARAAARLSHPNIVTLYDAGQAGGVPYLTMEYVEGVTLAQLVHRRGPLPVAEACDYVRQAALGLQHGHERGLVHRDIKPSNLIVMPASGQLKVLDFGLARLRERVPACAPNTEVTEEGVLMGTADYLAPEQALDARRVDIRADIYALGCTLYHLLAGQPPFPGASLTEKLLRHQRDEPPSLAALRPDLPEGLAGVVMRMMAKRPEERYQTPAEVAAALAPFCRESAPSGAGARRPGPGDRESLPSTLTAGPSGGAPRWRSRLWRRRGTLVALGGLALLLTLALALPGLWQPAPLSLESLRLYVRRNGDTEQVFYRDLVAAGPAEEPAPLSPPLGPRDDFKLLGRFNRPTYWYLVWLDSAGKSEVVAASDGKQRDVEYPVGNQFVRVSADDPPGVHLLLLVTGTVAPAEGRELLRDRLAGIGKPPAALPHRWSDQVRGPTSTPGVPLEPPEKYLRAVTERLPPGLEAMHALFLPAVQ